MSGLQDRAHIQVDGEGRRSVRMSELLFDINSGRGRQSSLPVQDGTRVPDVWLPIPKGDIRGEKMVKCEQCEAEEIPWDPFVVKGKDGKDHYFCCWSCRHAYELKEGILQPR
jgi:hypothetical protein